MMFPVYFLSFCVGFLSLSIEILWVRLFSFTNHSLPQAFAFVLMVFLVGIAMGAYVGKHRCHHARNLWEYCAIALLLSSMLDLIGPWIYGEVANTKIQITISEILILMTSALKAFVFPIMHHLGVNESDEKIGFAISRVYVANIIGATIGPIITGLLFLNIFSLQNCFVICSIMTFLLSLYCWRSYFNASLIIMMSSISAFMIGFIFIHQSGSLIAEIARHNLIIKQIVENRYGIIVIYEGINNNDIVTGSNVYDGGTNLDPVRNPNGINRAIILSAIQRHPERVLVLGLSIGTWLKLITTFPDIKHIDVIEINPGYLQAMKAYPAQLSALSDPRVTLYIDDGRRWLKNHPNDYYDLIVMNTTFYWRAYSSNLLSQEFLSMLKQHMKPHSIVAYNATGSLQALKTATVTFPYAALYQNIIIAGDFDWKKQLLDYEAKTIIASLKMDGKLLFAPNQRSYISDYLSKPIVSLYQSSNSSLEIITDRNLITEYKYGKKI